jgi:hypothetical protein
MIELIETLPDDEHWEINSLIMLYCGFVEQLSLKGGLPAGSRKAADRIVDHLTTGWSAFVGVQHLESGDSSCLKDSQMLLFRDSLLGLLYSGYWWDDLPGDSPLPSKRLILTDLYEASLKWSDTHEGPTSKLPPTEIWMMMIEPLVNYNTTSWPEIEAKGSLKLNSYTLLGKTEFMEINSLCSLFRDPLAIGTLSRCRERWFPHWNNHTDLDSLPMGEGSVAREVKEEMLPGIRRWLLSNGKEMSPWARSLLPFND